MADINRSNTSTTTMNIPYMSNSQRTTWEIKNFRPGVSKALEPWSLIDIDTTTDTMMDKGHISDAQLMTRSYVCYGKRLEGQLEV
jgi:hypothetical protein